MILPEERYYIKAPVLNTDVLERVQTYLGSSVKRFSSVKPAKMHLTLFHYGKPRELFKEFVNRNCALQWDGFSVNFDRLLEKSFLVLDKARERVNANVLGIWATDPTAEMMDLFGSACASVVVVRLTMPQETVAFRQELMAVVEMFLNECGIENPTNFIRESSNLKYQIDYHPHISIGFLDDIENREIPEVQVNGLQVLLGEPVLMPGER